ncbi:MAG: hypothetical protein R3F19_29675 [Verrucomicrobiales bacterium]
MNHIGGWQAYVPDPFFRRIVVIGWGSLIVCGMTLLVLKTVKRLNPASRNVAFVYWFAALVTIALLGFHTCLEWQYPRRQESFGVPWKYTAALLTGGIHTIIAISTVGIAIANARRIHRIVNASPAEISNNVVPWVGLCVAIIVVLVMHETLSWIEIQRWRHG